MDYASALESINWIGAIVGTVAAMFAGYVWYHEKVTGKAWIKLTGLKKKDVENAGMGSMMGGTLLLTFLSAAALSLIFNFVGVTNALDGVVLSALISVFFVGASISTNYLYEQRSVELLAINAGYNLIAFMIIGAILGAWQ